MSRDLAVITKVQKIEAIPNYDKVVKATIDNYPVIVQKDQFKEGDLCIYVGYDTLLPVKPEFEFLRKNSYSKLYDGFRMKNMKMCGMYSSGIAFSLNILPEGTNLKEGTDVTDVLGIRKYDPEELQEQSPKQMLANKHRNPVVLWFMRFKWFRNLYKKLYKKPIKQYPETVQKSDETNIEKLFNVYKTQRPDELYYLTEKMEGQAGAWMLVGKHRKYLVFSHNVIQNPKDNSNWSRVGKIYGLENILKEQKRNLCIQGEVCGPNIQKHIYGFTDLKLFVYKITDTDTGETFNLLELISFCDAYGLTFVPLLKTKQMLPNTLDEVLSDCEGLSVYGDKVPREGVVWRSMKDQSIGFKAKSRSYQLWFGGNKETL
jgi:hypothetical protein